MGQTPVSVEGASADKRLQVGVFKMAQQTLVGMGFCFCCRQLSKTSTSFFQNVKFKFAYFNDILTSLFWESSLYSPLHKGASAPRGPPRSALPERQPQNG